jgi:hypothetical protein
MCSDLLENQVYLKTKGSVCGGTAVGGVPGGIFAGAVQQGVRGLEGTDAGRSLCRRLHQSHRGSQGGIAPPVCVLDGSEDHRILCPNGHPIMIGQSQTMHTPLYFLSHILLPFSEEKGHGNASSAFSVCGAYHAPSTLPVRGAVEATVAVAVGGCDDD